MLNQSSVPMAGTPLVSILMLAYNHGPYIGRAIECILQQKASFSFELIIGEDCSTDNTREIVLEFKRRYPQIVQVIMSDRNVGMLANTHRVTSASRGRYIAYCEGDDYWHDLHKLERQVTFLEANRDYALVHTDFSTVSLATGKKSVISLRLPEDLDDDDAFNEILSGKRIVMTLTACMRRSVLESVERECPECYDSRFLMGDTQRWLEIARRGKLKYFPESTATYQLVSESATQSRDPKRVLRFALSAKDVLDHYMQKYGCPVDVKIAAKTRSSIQILSSAFRAGDVQAAEIALGEIKNVGARPPLEALLYYHGSRSKLCNAMACPALSIVALTNKVVRRLKYCRNRFDSIISSSMRYKPQ